MKKRLFLLGMLIALTCVSCRGVTSSEDKETPVCAHENFEPDSKRYEGGPACSDPVSVYMTCSDCGEEVKTEEVESKRKCSCGYDDKELVRKPTCTEEGLVTWNCSTCNTEYSYSMEKKPHYYLHFYGEEFPRCIECGQIDETETCKHEYEQMDELECSEYDPGKILYKCRHCDAEHTEYYDKYGKYELDTVLQELQKKAQQLGAQVVVDYEKLFSHYNTERNSVTVRYRKTTSETATSALLEQMDALFAPMKEGHSDLSEMYVCVQIGFDYGMTGPVFYVEILYIHKNLYIFELDDVFYQQHGFIF
jgi:hypothetical protein